MKDEKRSQSTFIPHPPFLLVEATKGFEPSSFGLQDRRSVIQLSYIAGGKTSFEFRVPSFEFRVSSFRVRVEFGPYSELET